MASLMPGIEKQIKSLAYDQGFDLIKITNAEPFLRDEQATLQRVRDGLMDGLPWYTEERVHKANHPELLIDKPKTCLLYTSPSPRDRG